jgi:hypothetical protein
MGTPNHWLEEENCKTGEFVGRALRSPNGGSGIAFIL